MILTILYILIDILNVGWDLRFASEHCLGEFTIVRLVIIYYLFYWSHRRRLTQCINPRLFINDFIRLLNRSLLYFIMGGCHVQSHSTSTMTILLILYMNIIIVAIQIWQRDSRSFEGRVRNFLTLHEQILSAHVHWHL